MRAFVTSVYLGTFYERINIPVETENGTFRPYQYNYIDPLYAVKKYDTWMTDSTGYLHSFVQTFLGKNNEVNLQKALSTITDVTNINRSTAFVETTPSTYDNHDFRQREKITEFFVTNEDTELSGVIINNTNEPINYTLKSSNPYLQVASIQDNNYTSTYFIDSLTTEEWEIIRESFEVIRDNVENTHLAYGQTDLRIFLPDMLQTIIDNPEDTEEKDLLTALGLSMYYTSYERYYNVLPERTVNTYYYQNKDADKAIGEAVEDIYALIENKVSNEEFFEEYDLNKRLERLPKVTKTTVLPNANGIFTLTIPAHGIAGVSEGTVELDIASGLFEGAILLEDDEVAEKYQALLPDGTFETPVVENTNQNIGDTTDETVEFCF